MVQQGSQHICLTLLGEPVMGSEDAVVGLAGGGSSLLASCVAAGT